MVYGMVYGTVYLLAIYRVISNYSNYSNKEERRDRERKQGVCSRKAKPKLFHLYVSQFRWKGWNSWNS